MASLDLHWLGPPRIEADGKPVKLETRKVTALLAFLSLERGPQSRDRLASFLWPEFDSQRAPANLRRALASLQASLGPGWLQADRDTVELNGEGGLTVDFDDVVRCVQEARAHHTGQADGLCARCREALERACAAHHGDFLEGLNLKDCPPFDDWQSAKRDELSQALAWALERLADANAEQGRWDDAIEMARRWVSLDALHEPAHRTLMFLYARGGKRSAALRQYEECARLLDEELGQKPDESTRALYDRIKQRKLDPAPPAAQEPAANAAPTALQSPAPAKAAGHASPPPTRLRPPAMRSALVQRARLVQTLDEGTTRPLTLVSAPAGFGKTTILVEWAKGCGLPVAWLCLEEADSDPVHLLAGIAAALGQREPAIGVEALQMLRSMQVPPASAVVASLLRDLALHPAPLVLVLDDFHLVSRPETQEIVANIVQHQPENFHMYVATRVDPSLPLARMRARAQLAEVRAGDLRFRPEEAAAFLRDVMHLDLSTEDVTVLEERTEGWAAGLQMAALSLQGRDARSAFIRNFGGSHRYIMDYLVGEVLEVQPQEVQDFLLKTSVLERFCAGLCDAAAGRTRSQPMLEELDRANLFLVALDDERLWYRYHHLFAELLRHRLRQRFTAEDIAAVHRRAGAWLEAADDVEAAMRHYLAGAHYSEAIRLVDARNMVILAHGGLSTLLAWAAQIPGTETARDPGACITLGTIYGWAGKGEEAERHFARAEAIFAADAEGGSSPGALALKGRAAAMRAFVADVAGDTSRAIELASLADGLLAPSELMLKFLLPYIMGKAYRYQGKLDLAEKCARQGIEISRKAKSLFSMAGVMHELVLVSRLQGRLREASKLVDDFEALPKEPGDEGPTVKVLADRAEVERERGDLASAEATMATVLQNVHRWGLPSDMYFCHMMKCRIELSAGRPDSAAKDVEYADQLTRASMVYSSMFPSLEAERVRTLLARGMLPAARAWMEEYRFPDEGSRVNRELILMTRARVLTADGRAREALSSLASLAAEAEAGGRGGRLLEILVLQAAAFLAAGDGDAAGASLRRALVLAEPEGYCRVFLDEGEPIRTLLYRLAESREGLEPHLSDFARRLSR